MSSIDAFDRFNLYLSLSLIGFHDRREAVSRHPKGSRRNIKRLASKRTHVDAVVAHSMGFDWGHGTSDLDDYDAIKAHFAVLRGGQILYLHDCREYLFASHDFNARGIAIEFAGNPPSETGKAHNEKKFGRHIPTEEQIRAGRDLLRVLVRVLGISHVFGHRQSCAKVCPGPHIWYNICRWGLKNLGLSDGGTGFSTGNKFCTGTAIPESWNDAKYSLDGGYAIPEWQKDGNHCLMP